MTHDLLLGASSHWHKFFVSATKGNLVNQMLWSCPHFIIFVLFSDAYSTSHLYTLYCPDNLISECLAVLGMCPGQLVHQQADQSLHLQYQAMPAQED